MKISAITLLLSSLIACLPAKAQNTVQDILQMQSPPLHYQVRSTHAALTIDGDDQEQDWQQAPWTADFVDIQGANHSKPTYKTAVKMLWDKEHLYIFAKLEEPHIWGTLLQHDTIIYHNNDFEVFIKPNENQDAYFEIEVNPLNTVMDLLMLKPYRYGGKAKLQWDVKGMKTAIKHVGTLNNPTDTDQYWTVEIAIPFQALNFFGDPKSPKIGDVWRLNFSRVQWQHQIHDGRYQRVKGKEEDNWVWSPIGIVNMHLPERWGYLNFIDQQPTADFHTPTSAALEKDLWNLHYAQGIYFQKNKKYAQSLQQLSAGNPTLNKLQAKYKIAFYTLKNYYRILLTDKNNPNNKKSIDPKGQLET